MKEWYPPAPGLFFFVWTLPLELGFWPFFFEVSVDDWRLGERPELEEAAQELEQRARGWLETDEARIAEGVTEKAVEKWLSWE